MKKRILLVSYYDRVSLSTRAIGGMLKKHGHEVSYIFLKDDRGYYFDEVSEQLIQYQELHFNKFMRCGIDVSPVTPKEWELFKDIVRQVNPTVVGVSSRSAHKELSLQTARVLKEVAPGVPLVAGGFGPSIEPMFYLKEFDFVCLGEGDEAFLRFVEAEDRHKSPNFAYLDGQGGLVHNSLLPPLNLNEIPWPDWSFVGKYMIDDEKVKRDKEVWKGEVYDIFASRGCISNCTYCMANHWGIILNDFTKGFPRFRQRTPRSVVEELKHAKEKYNPSFIRFMDSILGVEDGWFFEFHGLYQKEIGLPLWCNLDERYTNERIIKALAESRLTSTTVGIQSTNEEIRRKVFGRKISNKGLLDYAKCLVDHGIDVKYDVINWNPFENAEVLEKGLEFLKQFPKTSKISIYMLKVQPGSLFEKLYHKKKPNALSVEEYAFWAVMQSMYLFSEDTQKVADEIIASDSMDYRQAFKALNKYALDHESRDAVIVVARELRSGEKISLEDITFAERTTNSFISYSEKEKLLDLTVKHPIKKGAILTWGDIRSAYQLDPVKTG